MSKAWLTVIATLAMCVVLTHRAVHAQANFDRPGGDYLHTPVLSGDPEDCALACERDRRCRSWTFSYPSDATGAGALCWLKNSVPQRTENSCCISGVRGAGVVERRTGAVEMSTDRTGGDYHNFEITGADRKERDEVCRKACEADAKCRAWTYVRPGYIGRPARCFLKKEIKPPRRKPCCISGVVR